MMDRPLRIATRSSDLALRQARIVEALLAPRGITCELVTYKTVGDKKLDEPLSGIGAKGLFTKELEADLAKGKVDCCVHSLKDLPTESPAGLVVIAVLEREDPRDVLVVSSRIDAESLDEIPRGSRIGTSSLRRRSLLLSIRPDLEVVDLRGNVPTRLKKVDEGQVHAAILAAAGLHRLGAQQRITCYLEPPRWLPAAGQGAIAVQVRAGDDTIGAIVGALNHEPTMRAVSAERSFLASLEGGCQVPIGALVVGEELHGFIGDIRGTRMISGSVPLLGDAIATGIQLADQLRERGATEVLSKLQRAISLPAPQPE
ncbi:MAG: hemC [Gemmatimonadetes bacterium]|nr:hemC [Gemmatimonadota bacterium]